MRYLYLFIICLSLTGCQTMSDLLEIGSTVHEIGAGPTDAERKAKKDKCLKDLSNIPPTYWGKPNPDYEAQKKLCEGMK